MAVRKESRPGVSARRALAIDIGGTKIAAALVDERGRIRARLEERMDTSSRNAPVEQISMLAAELASTAVRRHSPAKDSFSVAGVAVPGLARPDGTVWAPNVPGWDRMPLARLLRQRLGVPVVVESDRNAVVIGEAWRGAARGRRDVVVLIVGTGIGAGIMSDGRILRGAHELSGCAGWMVVSDERNAWTARLGSLEALVAGPAIARGAGMKTAEQAAQAARRGDAAARRAFARVARLLGYAVANMVSLFDPEVVVLTGGVAGAADLVEGGVRRSAIERAQPLSGKTVDIRFSRLGADANLLGAARLAFQKLETRNQKLEIRN